MKKLTIASFAAAVALALPLMFAPAAAQNGLPGGPGSQIPNSSTVAAVPASAMPALTGDCTTSAGTVATTCLKTNGVAFTAAATSAAGQLPGTAAADSASAGNVGQYVSSSVLVGSAVSLTTDTPVNITSISLAAGDWDVSAYCIYIGGTTTTVKYADCSISQTTAALDQTPGALGVFGQPAAGTTIFANVAPTTLPLIPWRVSLPTNTTIFLVTQMGFSTSTASAYGIIRARRAR